MNKWKWQRLGLGLGLVLALVLLQGSGGVASCPFCPDNSIMIGCDIRIANDMKQVINAIVYYNGEIFTSHTINPGTNWQRGYAPETYLIRIETVNPPNPNELYHVYEVSVPEQGTDVIIINVN